MEQEYIVVYFNNLEDKPDTEEILCEKVSDNIYRILEIPLWAYSLAVGDIIKVADSEVFKKRLMFDDFVEYSGNSTLQIVEVTENGINQVLSTIEKIVGKDNIRFNSPSYIAVNVPAEIDYMPLRLFLKDYENKEIISFREATLGKNHEYDSCYGQSD